MYYITYTIWWKGQAIQNLNFETHEILLIVFKSLQGHNGDHREF